MTPTDFARRAPIHHDALPDYEIWVSLLRRWNQRINLVSPSAMSDLWDRHVLDSAQIWPLIPDDAKTIVDFGSGAGFPGLSLAIEAKHTARGQTIHMIESAGKKASFLKTVSRETSAPARIWSDRIEHIESLNADVITARAFAPLARLLPMARHHLKDGGQIVLLKGERFNDEVEEAEKHWSFTYETQPSVTQDGAVIARFTNIRPL